MLPLRAHLSIATAALVFVIPVVAGVIVGGFPAGVGERRRRIPCLRLSCSSRPTTPLRSDSARTGWRSAVYAVVMLLVARVVASLESARSEAQERAVEARPALRPVRALGGGAIGGGSAARRSSTRSRTVFEVPGVSLLVPEDGRLAIAASAGEALSTEELHQLDPRSGIAGQRRHRHPDDPMRCARWPCPRRAARSACWSMRGMPASEADRALLRTFANHAALALERAQLREQAMRSELLEEVDRLRHALVGAVSHDLRTPLATMKVASSTLLRSRHPALRRRHARAARPDRRRDRSADPPGHQPAGHDPHRGRGRSRSGEPQARSPTSSNDAVATLQSALGDRPIDVDVPERLPIVDVDQLLDRPGAR